MDEGKPDESSTKKSSGKKIVMQGRRKKELQLRQSNLTNHGQG